MTPEEHLFEKITTEEKKELLREFFEAGRQSGKEESSGLVSDLKNQMDKLQDSFDKHLDEHKKTTTELQEFIDLIRGATIFGNFMKWVFGFIITIGAGFAIIKGFFMFMSK